MFSGCGFEERSGNGWRMWILTLPLGPSSPFCELEGTQVDPFPLCLIFPQLFRGEMLGSPFGRGLNCQGVKTIEHEPH